MAREKLSSGCASDAQHLADTAPVVVADGAITPPPKRFYGPSMKQSGALAVGTMPQSGPRGPKTLAWFMDQTDLFEKQGRQSSSDESNEKQRAAAAAALAIGDERKKFKRFRKPTTTMMSVQGQARKESYAMSQATSESSEECFEEKRAELKPNGTNDEYWFYDIASDGYYYEQNGAKGWRRRQPNAAVHKSKDQEIAHMNMNGPGKYANQQQQQQQMMAAQAAQAALIHQALMQQQQAMQQQQPTMRYYDPNSDGFFYEMASVDGWKRRQPNKPVSASAPAGIARPYAQRQAEHAAQAHAHAMSSTSNGTSYGAALARGQMPRNTVHAEESSASSSTCGDMQDIFGAVEPLYPSIIARPSNLSTQMAGQMNPNFNADRFISDLSFSGLHQPKSFGLTTPTPDNRASSPLNSWAPFKSCSLFHPSPVKSISALEDEANINDLLKDLDKIWSAPAPLNKA